MCVAMPNKSIVVIILDAVAKKRRQDFETELNALRLLRK